MNRPTIDLSEFKSNIDSILTAVVQRGSGHMEPSDLGDLIGRIIATENIEAAKEMYEGLCMGIHHGIGLPHEQTNNRESISQFIGQWRS